MKTLILLTTVLFFNPLVQAEKWMIYTAHRGVDSRVYLKSAQGEMKVYQYPTSRLTDVEVVNNQVFIADAIAPRVYRLDLSSGDMSPVIDDWSLTVYYSVFSDGQFLYVEEDRLYRYGLDGKYESAARFGVPTTGMAWDGQLLWTLNNIGEVRAWDISQWPVIHEKPELAFPAPSVKCRGLFFDGRDFWTAESKDEEDGEIFRFNRTGKVLDKSSEPISRGWGIGFVEI